jgi:hypothetical protein
MVFTGKAIRKFQLTHYLAVRFEAPIVGMIEGNNREAYIEGHNRGRPASVKHIFLIRSGF